MYWENGCPLIINGMDTWFRSSTPYSYQTLICVRMFFSIYPSVLYTQSPYWSTEIMRKKHYSFFLKPKTRSTEFPEKIKILQYNLFFIKISSYFKCFYPLYTIPVSLKSNTILSLLTPGIIWFIMSFLSEKWGLPINLSSKDTYVYFYRSHLYLNHTLFSLVGT